MSNTLEIEVVGGLCKLQFRPGSSTGPQGSDTSPGVSFTLVSDHPARQFGDGKFYHGMGVIGRSDATALRDMLEIFLKAHARNPND